MSTKLEAMVGFLAGRARDPKLLDELADPSSEASRFLEATRARSRALLDPSPIEPRPVPSGPPRKAAIAILGSVILVALAAASAFFEGRLRRLEAAIGRREAESLDSLRKLEAGLARLSGLKPMDPALGRLEEGLGRLEGRLDQLEKRPADPAIARIREGLDAVRKDLEAAEKAKDRQSEEIQASVHEVGRMLKLLINRADPPANEPNPPNFPKNRPPAGPGRREP